LHKTVAFYTDEYMAQLISQPRSITRCLKPITPELYMVSSAMTFTSLIIACTHVYKASSYDNEMYDCYSRSRMETGWTGTSSRANW